MLETTEDTVRRSYGEDELAALLRFLRLSDPEQFQIAAVEIRTPIERSALIAWLRQMFPARLFHEVSLRELPGVSLVDELAPIVAELRCESGSPFLVLNDLEELQGSSSEQTSRTIAQLNVQRDLLVQVCPIPVLLCAHPAALLRLSVSAPDFYDYLSTRIETRHDIEGSSGYIFESEPSPGYQATLNSLDLDKSPEERVAHFRKLVTGGSNAYLPDLARSLRDLAVRQGTSGHHDVLKSAEEAVVIYKNLVRQRGNAFLPDLASSLHTLGAAQFVMGRVADSTRTSAAAFRLQKVLREHKPDALSSALPTGLDRIGISLDSTEPQVDARTAAEEAVQLYLRLARDKPDVFRPYLASSLFQLSRQLSGYGAIKAAEEAVQTYRLLEQQKPGAFASHLASSLNNLGVVLCMQGQRTEAINVAEEAIQIYRSLAGRTPETLMQYLAGSLNNLGLMQSQMGRMDAALASIGEAVRIYEILVKARPSVSLPDLAMSLNNLGKLQAEMGQHEAALASTEESVRQFETLAKDRPGAFLPDLAMSLNNLGKLQAEMGQHEAALASTEESVRQFETLAKDRPGAFLPDLAMSLNNLGKLQAEMGQHEAALVSTEEAARLRSMMNNERESVRR